MRRTARRLEVRVSSALDFYCIACFVALIKSPAARRRACDSRRCVFSLVLLQEAGEAKKKKKKKKKAKSAATDAPAAAVPSEPWTTPIGKLFPSRNFPLGEVCKYKDEYACAVRCARHVRQQSAARNQRRGARARDADGGGPQGSAPGGRGAPPGLRMLVHGCTDARRSASTCSRGSSPA